ALRLAKELALAGQGALVRPAKNAFQEALVPAVLNGKLSAHFVPATERIREGYLDGWRRFLVRHRHNTESEVSADDRYALLKILYDGIVRQPLELARRILIESLEILKFQDKGVSVARIPDLFSESYAQAERRLAQHLASISS